MSWDRLLVSNSVLLCIFPLFYFVLLLMLLVLAVGQGSRSRS